MRDTSGMSANCLKIIAVIAMTIDHIAWTLAPGYCVEFGVIVSHIIGRITAPIMWYFIIEGYYHTRNLKKYILRLFSLAFISHFAYNFCFSIPFLPFQEAFLNQTSVIWPLAWGLVGLWINDNLKLKERHKLFIFILICLITLPSDWSCIPVLAILFMHDNKESFKMQMLWMMIWSSVYAIVYFLFVDKIYGIIQLFTVLSIPFLKMYNGTKGRSKLIGKLFYFYYPAHLVILGVVRLLFI